MLKLPFLTATPPMATKIFLLASMSRELRCQCPIVAPAAWGGKVGAEGVPAASVNISDKAAIHLVMADLFVELIGGDATTLPGCAEAYAEAVPFCSRDQRGGGG